MEKGVSDHSFNKELHPLLSAHQRYWRTRKCVGSKAAVVILFWYFAIAFAYALLFNQKTAISDYLSEYSTAYMVIISSVYIALLQFLFPVAGYLADTKLGRFKTIQISLGILLLALLCLITAGGLTFFYRSEENLMTGVFYAAWLLFLFGLPGFNVNVIQFGLDQLFQTPADDQSLFILWYWWIFSLANGIVQLLLTINHMVPDGKYFFPILTIPFIVTTLIVLATFYLFVKKRNWFLIITRYKNPYMLVYKATKFSFRRRTPARFSYLTYGNENITSRLDLAKEKYRGPFTSEQVEDVKAFYGVLKVLIALIPTFFAQLAGHGIGLFASHLQSTVSHYNGLNVVFSADINYFKFILANSTIYYGTIFMIIPLFIFLLRPLVRDCIPSMLQRIGIGMILTLLSVIILLVTDILIHANNGNAGCIFSMHLIKNQTLESDLIHRHQYFTTILLIVQQVLSGLSDTIFYIALYQFICSQSPHSMKGFLLGIFFATRGVSHVLSAIFMLPLAMNKYTPETPSCCMVYYSTAVVVCVGGIFLYTTYIAKRYRLRVREDAHTIEPLVQNKYLTL